MDFWVALALALGAVCTVSIIGLAVVLIVSMVLASKRER